MISIVDATADHLAEFYPSLERTCRAWVLMDGDRVLGVCGFYRAGAGNVVFTEIRPELRSHPVAIVRAARRVLVDVKARGLPVFANCDFAVEASERFLRHFGFQQLQSGVFQCLE